MTAFVLLVLALASYRTTALFIVDLVPLGAVREWIWRRWPGSHDDRVEPTKIGELWECQSCMGVWHGAAWYGAWRCWPSATFAVACAAAIMGVQRIAFVVSDAIASYNKDED